MKLYLQTLDTQLKPYNGQLLIDIKPLDSTLYDRKEVGEMFEASVVQEDGSFLNLQLFADEIVEK